MKSIYFVLDKNILPETTTTIEWKSAIISRAESWQVELYSQLPSNLFTTAFFDWKFAKFVFAFFVQHLQQSKCHLYLF